MSRSRRRAALFEAVWSMGERHPVWMSHGDRITKLPPGFEVAGTSANAPFAMIAGREAQILRPDVPSRGGAHARRRQAAPQLRPQGRRPHRRLDHARLPRGGDREDPRPGRQGQGDLRPLRRRRFRGGRRADPRGDRRPAHLRLRRSRPAAARRGRDRGRPVPRPLQHPAGACGCLEDRSSRELGGRQRPRTEAQDHRPPVHRRVRGGGQEDRRAPISWPRARSIPT